MALLKDKGKGGEMSMLEEYHKMLLLDKLDKDKGKGHRREGATQQDKMSNDGSRECTIDRLSDDIVHYILSRLSIVDLFRAGATCVAWRRMASSHKRFDQLYDKRNDEESWIALSSTPNNPHHFFFFHINLAKWLFLQVNCRYHACIS